MENSSGVGDTLRQNDLQEREMIQRDMHGAAVELAGRGTPRKAIARMPPVSNSCPRGIEVVRRPSQPFESVEVFFRKNPQRLQKPFYIRPLALTFGLPHNPKVPGSNPGPATNQSKGLRETVAPFFMPGTPPVSKLCPKSFH